MKRGYRIISNENSYKIQKFYSMFFGILSITKTYKAFYFDYNEAVEKVESMKTIEKNIRNNRAYGKKIKSKPWKIIKTFLD